MNMLRNVVSVGLSGLLASMSAIDPTREAVVIPTRAMSFQKLVRLKRGRM